MTNIQTIQNAIIEIRKQKVLLDSQLADFYGVETRDINKAVKNNPDKFPEGYVFPTSALFQEGQTTLPNKTNGLRRLRHYIKSLLFASIYSLIYCEINMA